MYYHSSEGQGGKRGVESVGVGSAGSEGKHKSLTFFRHKGCANTSRSGEGGGRSINGELILLGNGSPQLGTSTGSGPSLSENQALTRGDCRWISMRLSHARMDLKRSTISDWKCPCP